MKPALAFFSRLLISGSVFMLASCTTLGPDYTEPDVHWLDNWELTTNKIAGTDKRSGDDADQLDLRFWWTLFDDPVLNRLIDSARQNSLTLRIAGLRIIESQALLGIATSGLYPQVQKATGAIGYVNTKGHNGASPEDRQSVGAYQVGLNLNWELDFWGRFARGIESADASFFASRANQRDVQVLLSAQVTDLYYAYRIIENQIEIARKNADIQKRSLEITELLFKRGEDSELDVQQAKTQYLATLSKIPELEITLIRTRNALSVLLGRAPGSMPELAEGKPELPTVSLDSIQDIPAGLLLRRPDVREGAWQVAAQSAQIGLAEADFYPSVSLLGSIGVSGSSLSGNPYTDNLLLGPGVNWNIFDYGRIESNVRVQDVRLQQLIEQYQNTVLQAAREVDDAAYSVLKTEEQNGLTIQSVNAAERALAIANTRYREGYSDFQRVLDAQRSFFFQAERQLANHGVHISSIISLYKGLGGGWIETPVELLIPEEVKNTMQARTDWGNLLDNPLPVTEDPPNE